MKGNWGKILKVDLTEGTTGTVELEDKSYRDYLGGSGLAAKWFFDNKCWKADPLSPGNPLIFMLGPLSGSNLPGTGRLEICGRSPLTKIWGEACMGGFFAPQLRATGYDGIIITGASDKPVYLYVTDEDVEIRDASHLWGKDTYVTEDTLKEEVGEKRAQVACIGPAGENQVLYACIMNNKGSTAGRGGMGALMGSKKLKAVVVRGKMKMEFDKPEKVKELGKQVHAAIKAHVLAEGLGAYGSNVYLEFGMATGDSPTKNWNLAYWPNAPEKMGGVAVSKTILTDHHGCHGCPVGCKRITEVSSGDYRAEKGPGAEYEGIVALGALLLIDDLEANNKANEMCNRYGMDVISTGGTLAYATEAYEKGLLSNEDTGGIELGWGKPKVALELIDRIAARKGFGDILADGSRAASRKFGGEEFAIHVKGMECPMHDPRALWGMALTYGTSIRGACHCADTNLYTENGIIDNRDLGATPSLPFRAKGKAADTIASQKKGNIDNSAVICAYVDLIINDFELLADLLKAITGFTYTKNELATVGDRLWYLKRSIGNLCGATREDDRVPERILSPHPEGTTSILTPVIFAAMRMMAPLQNIRNEKITKQLRAAMGKVAFPQMNNLMKIVKNMLPNYWVRRRKQARRDPKMIGRATIPYDKMLSEYYELREIDEQGRPGKKKLESLGLNDVAKALHGG
ncbi:MAG: aldehyde ferredoxin oxidoreductase family protein [Actinobacteria bacterium]|nr:aldehyde ferredoxin oxidoreductase family protein [Actinomycetota bacterium]